MPKAITCPGKGPESSARGWIKTELGKTKERIVCNESSHLSNGWVLSYPETKERINKFTFRKLFRNTYYKPSSEGLLSIEEIMFPPLRWITIPSASKPLVPDPVRFFIEEAKLPANSLEQLSSIMERIKDYLKKHGYDHTVELSLSSDPEFPEMKEIKIFIIIAGVTIKEIYEKLWNPFDEYIFQGISDEIQRKILLKIEPK